MSEDILELQLLIQKAQRGDESAFEVLLSRYESLIFRLVYSMLRDREDARDVTQEVFIKLWQTLPKYRFESTFLTYLTAMARNAALDFLRKTRQQRQSTVSLTQTDEDGELVELTVADPDRENDPVHSVLRAEQAAMVQRALLELPVQAREIIALRTVSGLSYEKIAEVLGLEIGTVKSRLNRAKISLIKILEQWNFF